MAGWGTLIALCAITVALLFQVMNPRSKMRHRRCRARCPRDQNQQLSLPPGPSPWPVVGNLAELWRNKPAFKWIHGVLRQFDSDICCIRLGNVHVVPITSPEIALEVLRNHDSVFASRPLTMGTEYSSRGFLSIAVVPWGHQWKKMRKVVATHVLNPARLQWLLLKRSEEADNLVRFVYNQSSRSGLTVNLRFAARQYCGNVIRKMMFSRRYFGDGEEDGGPGFEEEEHVESLFVVLQHLYSFALSDYLPWLRLFDLDGHEKTISNAMGIISKYHDPIIDERVQKWRGCRNDNGSRSKTDDVQDLLDVLISAKDKNGRPALSAEEIKAQCIDLMLATVDNPSNAIEWAMAEMINQPQILEKATEEIDMVVGKERLVRESDIPKLNYVKACLREVLRLHPVAPFNLPHVSTRHATVAGYFIPQGSHVLISRIGLGRNASVWEDPLRFYPERHIGGSADDQVELTEPELRFMSFSRGRRGCIGVALGSEMSVMLLARLLQGFDWRAPSDDREKIDLVESEDDLLMAKPLHARANPRLPVELYGQI